MKLLPWLLDLLSGYSFQTVLEPFGGTGALSYAMKCAGKSVHYNDYLEFNQTIGFALIENNHETVSSDQVDQILRKADSSPRPGFIHQTFHGIYFTDSENIWLDSVIPEILAIENQGQRSILLSALFQACIIKRPYNLFHRANLYMRTQNVERSFGNKVTWDRPFPDYLRKFVSEFNAAVILSPFPCRSTCLDVLDTPNDADLVYLDPPYTNHRGTSVDYHDFYHFLDGLLNYDIWEEKVDFNRKNRCLHKRKNPWSSKATVVSAFQETLEHFSKVPVVAISYRGDGIPSIQDITTLMRQQKREVSTHSVADYQYALSGHRAEEVLIIGHR